MHRKRLAKACTQLSPAPHLATSPTDHADAHPHVPAHPHAPARPRARTFARTLAATLVAVAAVSCGTGYLAATARASTAATPTEKRVLALVNHVRATHGLARLRIVSSLERASRAHSREMVGRDYFSHSSYSGTSFSTRLIRFGFSPAGYRSWAVGEDIAYGSGSRGTAAAIFRAWMRSPSHRAVILTARYRSVGVGRAAGTYKGTAGVVFFTLDCGVRSQ
jgi:uncharacterized protein YkwD